MDDARFLSPTPRSLGVALGGGGMKGWAHLGVISVLERYGLHPDVVSATSAGALIGAFWAAGYSVDEMRQLMREQRTNRMFTVRFDGVGLFSQDGLRAYLEAHLGDRTFADLPIPLRVIATDLETGREVILRSGRVVDALLASSAMPGVFAPVEIDGQLLVDGGLMNNVPVSALVHAGARHTLAVQLRRPKNRVPMRRDANGRDANGRFSDGSPEQAMAGGDRVGLGLWASRLTKRLGARRAGLPGGLDVASRALDIVTQQVEDLRLHFYPPDVLVGVDIATTGLFSFSDDKEAIYGVGQRAAEQHADALADLARLAGREPA